MTSFWVNVRRRYRWIVLGIALVCWALYLSGLLSLGEGMWIALLFEGGFALLVLIGGIIFSADARKVLDFGSVEHSQAVLVSFLPRRVARLVATEWAILTAPWLWIFRRRRYFARPGRLSYNGQFRWMMLTAALLGVFECWVLYVVVDSEVFRWIHLIVSLYGVLWLVGLSAAASIYAHSVRPSGLRLRFSVFHDISIDVPSAGFVAHRRTTSGRRKTVEFDAASRALSVSVLGGTNVRIEFDEDQEVLLTSGQTVSVRTIDLHVDDPSLVVSGRVDRRDD